MSWIDLSKSFLQLLCKRNSKFLRLLAWQQNDGQPINLHHMTQTQGGAIAEVTQAFHQQNFGTIHINTRGLPSGINRAEFDVWRTDYWRNRAVSWEQ